MRLSTRLYRVNDYLIPSMKVRHESNVTVDNNGAYLLDCRLADPWKDTVRPWATNAIEAEKLWKLSEELVGQKFEY